jgi:hypothetical protein
VCGLGHPERPEKPPDLRLPQLAVLPAAHPRRESDRPEPHPDQPRHAPSERLEEAPDLAIPAFA